MASRPFISLGIDALEALFEEKSSDRSFRERLLYELSHRSTRRAKRLEARAKRARQELCDPTSMNPDQSARAPVSSHRSTPRSEPHPYRPYAPEGEIRGASISAPGASWKPRSRPPVNNSPSEILSAWIAQEVLSPSTYGKPEEMVGGDYRDLCDFSDRMLPWEGDGEKARSKTKLFYHLVFGSISMSEATQSLLEVYADSRPEPPSFKGKRAAIAIVTVDRAGKLAENSGVVVSGFAWGLGVARGGDLRRLSAWPEQGSALERALHERLFQRDDDGVVLPLTKNLIRSASNWLRDALNLSANEIEAPRYALRVYQWVGLYQDPDPPMLNSFFLGDLARVKKQVVDNKANRSLRQFLAIDPQPPRIDLLQDQSALRDVVSPVRMPPGRWPGQGRHPLVLLQQAAINIALSELKDEGIVGVNGPPGTGKTTLLRDLVAALVIQRAEAMSAYDDPKTAFSSQGGMKVGRGFVQKYSLASDLKGYEMLVASSNNKAVENISKELPGLDAIDCDLPAPRYFRTTSDAIAGEGKSWGLIAAVLGNRKNVSAFRKAFWQNEDTGLKNYLKEVAGQPIRITDPRDPAAPPREPTIVQNEQPPRSHDEALRRWRKARTRLKAALEAVRRELRSLEQVRCDLVQLPSLEQARKDAAARHDRVTETLASLEVAVALALAVSRRREAAAQKAVSTLTDHRSLRPGLFLWLLGPEPGRPGAMPMPGSKQPR